MASNIISIFTSDEYTLEEATMEVYNDCEENRFIFDNVMYEIERKAKEIGEIHLHKEEDILKNHAILDDYDDEEELPEGVTRNSGDIDLDEMKYINIEILSKILPEFCFKYRIFPVRFDFGRLTIAVDPVLSDDFVTLGYIKDRVLGDDIKEVLIVISPRESIERAICKYYSPKRNIEIKEEIHYNETGVRGIDGGLLDM